MARTLSCNRRAPVFVHQGYTCLTGGSHREGHSGKTTGSGHGRQCPRAGWPRRAGQHRGALDGRLVRCAGAGAAQPQQQGTASRCAHSCRGANTCNGLVEGPACPSESHQDAGTSRLLPRVPRVVVLPTKPLLASVTMHTRCRPRTVGGAGDHRQVRRGCSSGRRPAGSAALQPPAERRDTRRRRPEGRHAATRDQQRPAGGAGSTLLTSAI